MPLQERTYTDKDNHFASERDMILHLLDDERASIAWLLQARESLPPRS